MPVRAPAAPLPAATDYPSPPRSEVAPAAPVDRAPFAMLPGEDVRDFFDRVAPLVAQSQAACAMSGDGKAARWLLENSSVVRDRISTPIEVSHEDLSNAEGVSRTMRKIAVHALRGDLGLTEARRASDLVKETSESMFADEIASLRDAIDRAKRNANFSLRAVTAQTISRGAVDAEEVDAGDPLLIEEMTAVPAPRVVEHEPAPVSAGPRPSWGRFADLPAPAAET